MALMTRLPACAGSISSPAPHQCCSHACSACWGHLAEPRLSRTAAGKLAGACANVLSLWLMASLLLPLCNRSPLRRLTLNRFGSLLAHLGVAVCALGIAQVSHHSQEGRRTRRRPTLSARRLRVSL